MLDNKEQTFRICMSKRIQFMYKCVSSERSQDIEWQNLNGNVKVKLSLYLVKHHAMKTYGGVEI
jgi:hypothetical protein